MIAVLLLAFGCPDSPESIEPFITNIMAGRKPSPEQLQKIKERYLKIGGHSPLLDITRKQAEALEAALNRGKGQGARGKEFKIFVGMRHWHPFIKDTLKEIVNSGAKKIIAIIMSPHYSKFIADGYTKAINDAKAELPPPLPLSRSHALRGNAFPRSAWQRGGAGGGDISFVKGWHTHPLFIEAVADEIKKGMSYFTPLIPSPLMGGGQSLPPKYLSGVQVIFSAHSLPINKPAPASSRQGGQGTRDEGRGTRDEGIGEELYVRQLNETIEAIIKLTGNLSWHLGFQSKGMSKGEWLEPTVDSILERLSKDGKKYVLLVPIGFVSDHIETLYDIDMVYKEMAESLGMTLHRTNSLNDSTKFIEALAKVVMEKL